MSSFELTDLQLTATPEQVEPDAYIPPYSEKSISPVDRGTYTVKFIGQAFKGEGDSKKDVVFTEATCKKDGQKYLAARICVEVQDAVSHGKPSGTKRVYGRVDAIPEGLKFNNVKPGREKASAFMDMLKAAGFTGSLRTWDDYQNALLGLIETETECRALVTRGAYSNPKSTDYAGSGLSWKNEEELAANAVPGDPDRVYSPGEYAEGQRPILLIQNDIKTFFPASKGK